jgi:uncharacterized protein involved in type VI secretion and phage assembly
MSSSLIDGLAEGDTQSSPRFAIAPGVVTNNVDLIAEGRVQVRVPSRNAFEPWARLPVIGGSDGRGFLWIPQIDDEVLVAFAEDNMGSAYVLGGLWSSMNRPPVSLPNDFLTKRVIKTGMTSSVGHQLEFDDLKQSVTITTSTEQKVTLEPTKIELSSGGVSIKIDTASQEVAIVAVNKISLKALTIELNAPKIDLKGTTVSVNATGPVTVSGLPIKLN